MQPGATVTPGSSVARVPLQHPSPTTMPATVGCPARRARPPSACVEVQNITSAAMSHSEPILIAAEPSK